MKYDVIIVGAGVMGASTAYHLSKTGKKVLLLDQYEIANKLNSSQDYSRVFRYVYGDDPFYAKLAVESLRVWKEIEKDAQKQLYYQCGCLLLGKEAETYAMKSYKTMNELGLPIELLEGEKLRERFPQFNEETAVLDPNGGVIEASTATVTLVELAERNGVEVRPNTKVKDIVDGAVHLENGETLEAAKIVVTAGVWNTKLLQNRVKVVPSRQEIIYFKPKKLEMFEKEKFPTFGHLESGFYGIPMHRINAVKIANHYPGESVDPDTVDRNATEKFIDDARAFLEQYIPGLADAEVLETKVCMYDMTQDEDFILDHISENVIVGAGFSGHGFKFASMIGKILSELAVEGKSSYEISRFALAKNS